MFNRRDAVDGLPFRASNLVGANFVPLQDDHQVLYLFVSMHNNLQDDHQVLCLFVSMHNILNLRG